MMTQQQNDGTRIQAEIMADIREFFPLCAMRVQLLAITLQIAEVTQLSRKISFL